MMDFLQKAINDAKKPASIIPLLDNHLSGYRKARGFKSIHASSLTREQTEFCPREVALIDILGIKQKDEYISTSLQVAFDQGESLHQLARNTWLRGSAIGSWKCSHCKTILAFRKAPKHNCAVCGGKNWDYLEENFISQTCDASGSLDILIDVGQPKYLLTEIKTMDKDQFKKLLAPLAEHRIRTNFYMWLVRDSGRIESEVINTDFAKVLYISKAYGSKNDEGQISPFKEFEVAYEPKILQPYIDKALKIKNFRGIGIMPDRICPTSFVGRVKSCTCPKDCWSQQFPAGGIIKWKS